MFSWAWMYAVTTDAGKSWSVWDAARDLPGWQCCDYVYIQAIDLAVDGTGTMAVDTERDVGVNVSELQTHDHGQHWSARLNVPSVGN